MADTISWVIQKVGNLSLPNRNDFFALRETRPFISQLYIEKRATLVGKTEARVLLETQQCRQPLKPEFSGFSKLSFSFHKDAWNPITYRHPAGQAKSGDDEDSPRNLSF